MTAWPEDDVLTTEGMTALQKGRVLLLACGALAREILDLIKINGWDHIDLQCLPAIYHNHPDRIVPAIAAAVTEHQKSYDQIFVVYADCGTGGQLQTACEKLGVTMMPGPHCYAFFAGNDRFAAQDEMTAFYLTDFLVRQFDAFVWEPLGFARHPRKCDTLREMYFGHYTKVIYQAQTDDPVLTQKAAECAARLKLPIERQYTGYGDLETKLMEL